MRRTIYYKDMLNDDFADNGIKRKKLPRDYQYISKDPLRKTADFMLHHFVATPIAYIFQKVVYREKIVNRKVLQPYLINGFYIYGNHTRAAGDAFTPHLIAFPRKAYILAAPEAVSIPIVRHLVKSLGGFPVPSDVAGMKNFHSSLLKRAEHNCITIYPEAHIWPYFTQIRPFLDASFRYPAETGKPVFAFTVTYHKRFLTALPRTVVYIDGPFFADPTKKTRENQAMLRDKVYEAMCRRSIESDYSYNTYVPVENDDAD